MRISQEGLEFIQRWEDIKLKAYLDIAGIPTIGWGTIVYPTQDRVQLGDEITREQADVYLEYEVNKKTNSVSFLIYDLYERALLQSQVDALISLTYNIGSTAFKRSTVRKLINQGVSKYNGMFDTYWLAWNKVTIDGKLVLVKGLLNRRREELRMFRKEALGDRLA